MGDSQQLSRRAAIIVGGLTIVGGAVPLALMLRGVARPPSPSSPPMWLGAAIALVFILAGCSIIFDYAIGHGRTPDGGFLPGTPFYVRVTDTLLGLTIVGLMVAVFSWVAFGPGPRQFSTSVAIPFLAVGSHSSELPGRIAFGLAAALFAIAFAACGVSGLRRLVRTHRALRLSRGAR